MPQTVELVFYLIDRFQLPPQIEVAAPHRGTFLGHNRYQLPAKIRTHGPATRLVHYRCATAVTTTNSI